MSETIEELLTKSDTQMAAISKRLGDEMACPYTANEAARIIAALRTARAQRDLALEALKPFAHYGVQRDRMPMRGLGDTIHGIHTGTEFEAELRLSDCRKAVEVLQNAQ